MQEIKQWQLVWHEEHMEKYQKFLFDFGRLSVARQEFLIRLCQAVVSNLPEETKEVYEYIKAEAEQGDEAGGLENKPLSRSMRRRGRIALTARRSSV